MIDKRFYGRDELYGVRQRCVYLERRFVAPPGVNKELAVRAHGLKGLIAQAAGFEPCGAFHLANSLAQCGLTALTCTKPSEEEELHATWYSAVEV